MKRLVLIIAAAAALAAACTKQSLQATYDKQTTFIENFIAAQMKADSEATLVRKGGAYRLTLQDHGDPAADSLALGGQVTLYYGCFVLTGATLNASNLVSTNLQDLATQAKWTVTDTDRFQLLTLTVDDTLLEGLRDGLQGVQPGDQGYILFTGKYGYGSAEKGTIPARSALAYYFWIESINNE